MIERILVPLDGSSTAERALPHAGALARLFRARLYLARVPETMVVPVMSGAIWVTEEIETRQATEQAEAYLADLKSRSDLDGVTVETLTPPHPVAGGLLEAIAEIDAHLVVMTSHGYSGFKRFVFGSVADKLVAAAPASVYLVREPETPPGLPEYRRVLVPLDGSAPSESALPTAASLARASGASLILTQIPTVPGYVTSIPETAGWIPRYLREQATEATTYLQAQAERLASGGLSVDVDVEVITAGSVADGILSAAQEHDADVILMSTHGRSGLGRWFFGSVADQVIRAAQRPVWLVRAGPASTARGAAP